MASFNILKVRVSIAIMATAIAGSSMSFLAAPISAQSENSISEGSTTIGTYQTMLGAVSVMSNQYPRLQELRAALADECNKKILPSNNIIAPVNYCYCAGVVTTAIWMTYPDTNIRTRLVDIMDKGQGNINELATFITPDLYHLSCKAVDADRANIVQTQKTEK